MEEYKDTQGREYEGLLPHEERYLNVLVAQICADIERERHPEAVRDTEDLKRIGNDPFYQVLLKKVS